MSRHSACIVGIGQSDYLKRGLATKSQFQMTGEAILAAAKDAGIAAREIDGLCSYSNDANDAHLMANMLGMEQLRVASMVWGGGGGGSGGSIALASAAIEAGYANYVVAYRGLCQGQGRRFGSFNAGRTHANFVHPFGLFTPAQMLALLVQRYMHLYGATDEHLAEIALSTRAYANRNPHAVMRDKIMTRDDYFASRIITSPFRLLDCCLETDGACAVVLTSLERARDLPGKPVAVLAAAQGTEGAWGSGPFGSHNMPDETYVSANQRGLSAELFERAGVTPGDIDVAEIYDHFTGMVLIALEDHGFCRRGEAAAFVEDGNIRPSGALPLNTHGGNLSEAYMHGMNHIVEGVRQLRGISPSQVEGAKLAFVAGAPGIAPTSALILGTL